MSDISRSGLQPSIRAVLFALAVIVQLLQDFVQAPSHKFQLVVFSFQDFPSTPNRTPSLIPDTGEFFPRPPKTTLAKKRKITCIGFLKSLGGDFFTVTLLLQITCEVKKYTVYIKNVWQSKWRLTARSRD